ncbi:MAG: hypothetical protein CV087_24230, partial [Candidatus Brocadia sp. WS118]
NNYRDGDGRCVVAQIFDSSGTKQGDEFIVNTTTSGTQFSPSVSYVDQDRFVVAWGGGIVLGNNNQIYCQVFNDQGQKIGNEILVPTTLAGYKWKSTVLGLNDNTFVVSWSSTYEYESIYCQKFDLNGNKIGSEVRVNNFDVRSWHSLATTDNGFIVIWSRQYSPTYVEAQILDLNLNLVGSPIRISDGGPNTTLSVDITRLSNNCYATVWAEFSDVYCQLLDSTLSKIGFNFILNDYRTSIQEAVRTEAIPGYGFVNCWHSYGNDGRYYGIFGKIMPDEPVIRALNSFNLLEPEDDSTLILPKPTLIWEPAHTGKKIYPWEVVYDLYLDENENFSNPVIFSSLFDTTIMTGPLQPGSTYFWKVRAKNHIGDTLWSTQENWAFFIDPNAVPIIMENNNNDFLPTEFELVNYPNPFNPTTTIRYTLPGAAAVTLEIYTVTGQRVHTLVSRRQQPGEYSAVWDGRNNHGHAVSSGVYIYRLQAGDEYVQSRKMVLLR